jgi:hypothetical protein
MRIPRFCPHFPSILFLSLLLLTPVSVLAQGDTFSDCATWEAAVCGSVVDDGFDGFVDFDGAPVPDSFFGAIPSPQSVVWGDVSQEGNSPAGLAFFSDLDANGVEQGGVLFDDGRPVVMTPNGVLGPLQGICIDFEVANENVANSGAFVNFYDGDTLVETVAVPIVPENSGNSVPGTFGWINTDGINVTRFEFAVQGGTNDLGVVRNAQLAFGESCDPPAETCFEGLAAVKADIEALLATSTASDACYLTGALDCVCWMQNDCFWEQPSGNRLSQYGGSMFVGAAYAVCYLEWVDDPQADVIIDDLLAVLECIVDNEIAYAIENGGAQCYIDRAEDYAELGEIIDEDFDNQVVATLAYRLAWLHAYYSTY